MTRSCLQLNIFVWVARVKDQTREMDDWSECGRCLLDILRLTVTVNTGKKVPSVVLGCCLWVPDRQQFLECLLEILVSESCPV